jgi:hypothetical protein
MRIGMQLTGFLQSLSYMAVMSNLTDSGDGFRSTLYAFSIYRFTIRQFQLLSLKIHFGTLVALCIYQAKTALA